MVKRIILKKSQNLQPEKGPTRGVQILYSFKSLYFTFLLLAMIGFLADPCVVILKTRVSHETYPALEVLYTKLETYCFLVDLNSLEFLAFQ